MKDAIAVSPGSKAVRGILMRATARLLLYATILAMMFAAPHSFAGEVIRRGVAIPPNSRIVPLGNVLASPQGFTREDLVTEGTVLKVCRLAGCWMSLAPEGASKGLRVTFKGGAFVVPRSSRGSRARVIGRIRVAGDDVTFVASGVELTARSK